MIEAKLGVTTCDKCQKPMTKGQHIPLIPLLTEGITHEQPHISC